jgi:hypothetical protein
MLNSAWSPLIVPVELREKVGVAQPQVGRVTPEVLLEAEIDIIHTFVIYG